MRRHLVLLDADGWADGVLSVAETAAETALRGRRAVEVDQETAHAVGLHTELYYRHQYFGLQRLGSQAAIYRRLRACAHPRTVMQRLAELEGHEHPRIPVADRACPCPPSARRPDFTPATVGAVGVSLCDEAAFASLEATVEASGLYDPAAVWRVVRGWECDPHTWPLVWTWRGQALQYEVIHLDPPARRARFGFTTHLTPERPAWFWQRAEVPVLRALHEAGIDDVVTVTRADARHWIDSVTAAYGAAERRYDGAPQWVRLVFDPARALAAVDRPWPAPRTAGPDWRDAVRESSIHEARGLLTAAWGSRGRLAYMRQLLEERTALDAATVLVGEIPGEPADVYVVRERRETEASVGCLTPFRGTSGQGHVAQAVARWHRAVGYLRTSVFVTLARRQAPLWQQWERRWGFTAAGRQVTRGTETWEELVADLGEALGRPEEAWTA